MNSIMGPIAPEQLERFALELGKIATFDFVYSLASTNLSQSAPDLVTMNMSIVILLFSTQVSDIGPSWSSCLYN